MSFSNVDNFLQLLLQCEKPLKIDKVVKIKYTIRETWRLKETITGSVL